MSRIELSWCRWSLLGLVILQPLWFGWVQQPEHLPVLLVVAAALAPLLIVLPGVWKLRVRPLVIAGFILLLYFSFGVMEAWANPGARIPALLQVALIIVYFVALPTVRRSPAGAG
ncbi:MAG: DUF2069 domain-containing protein [Wenzhouxiangella sp.]